MRRVGKGFSGRVTPLFPTMVVQSKLGEGSAMPTDPHRTPTILQSLSSQPQKTHKTRKPTRKVAQVPQPSDPMEHVANEAVHKELGDNLVRAATTASSLGVEQDSGIIAKKVLELEKTKTSQHNEIASLKRGVKKLKKRNRSRTHKLKRLYKVGLTARVESLDDEESLCEDASKQGRIKAIDADEDITLVNDQDATDKDMFDVNVLGGKEVFAAAGQNENVVNITTEELTLAQALKALKTSKPKVKGLVTQEPSKIDADYHLAERLQAQEQKELSDVEKATLFQQLLEKRTKHFAAKRVKEKKNKPPIKAQQRKIMCTYLKNIEGYKLNDFKLKEFNSIKEIFDKAFRRVNTFVDYKIELVKEKEKRAGEELIQKSTKKQKVDNDKEKDELKQLMEPNHDKEEVAIDTIPLTVKEDLEDLYKLVSARYGSTRPVENMDLLLWGYLKTMFEPHVEDEVWKKQQGYKVLEWKLYNLCRVHSLMMQSM
uniref:Uncharacterized protein n=1 Tax=Tanacetum cinerariifolium TaxID=118510 RepID=A0A699HXK7_TANCI|nr:hypothetical protein [Tanacetum cinerariifolium]